MIDELMDFARGRLAGGIPIRRTLVDLHRLCGDVVEEAQAAHGRTVRLKASGDLRGHWDSDRLAQLVSNLVGNALQHSPADSLVRVTVRNEDGHAVLEVNNSGRPIPVDQLRHIFEPFRRGKTTESDRPRARQRTARSVAAGFDAVISKPCLPEDLATAIEGLLAHPRDVRVAATWLAASRARPPISARSRRTM